MRMARRVNKNSEGFAGSSGGLLSSSSNRIAFSFFACFFIAIFSAVAGVFVGQGTWLSLLGVLLVAVAALLLIRANDILLRTIPIYNLVALSLAFPLGGVFLASGVSPSVAKYISGARPIFLFVLIAVYLVISFVRSQSKKDSLYIVGCFVVVLAGFVFSGADLQSRVAYLANSFLPLFGVIYAIRESIDKPRVNESGEASLVLLAFFLLLVGAIFNALLFLGSYDIFRPDLYFSYRDRGEVSMSYGDFPRPWLSSIGGVGFFRMSGLFSDPIQWGYFCSLTLLGCYFKFVRSGMKVVYLAVMFVPLLFLMLSGSKGSWLLFLGVVFIFHSMKNGVVAGRLSILFYFIAVFVVSSLPGTSGVIHLAGLVGGVTSVLGGDILNLVFGFGMGSGGNLITSVGGDVDDYRKTWLLTGSESGYGVFIYQLGIAGTFLFVAGLLRIRLSCISFVGLCDRKVFTYSLVVAYFVLFLLQENLVNSAFLYMLLALVIWVNESK